MAIDTSNPFLIGANPENFGGNRRDDFGGLIVANILMPWRFPGAKPREDRKTGKKSTFPPYSLFARVTILADEDSPYGATEENEMIQAGYLASSAPTDDGEKPKGASWEQYAQLDAGEAEIGDGEEEDLGAVYVMGKRKNFKLPSSDYAQFLWSIDRLIKDATEAEVRAHGWQGWTPGHDCIVGLHMHFNLLDRDEKMGNRRPTENKDPNAVKRDFKILCATALLDPVGKPVSSATTEASTKVSVSVGKPASASKTSTATPTTTTAKPNGPVSETPDDFESNLEGFVITQIVSLPATGKKPNHGNIMAEVPASFPGNIQRAITLLNGPWANDAARPWVRKSTGYELRES